MPQMGKIGKTILLIAAVLGLASCKKPLEQPELIDPVYSQLEKEHTYWLQRHSNLEFQLENIKTLAEKDKDPNKRQNMLRRLVKLERKLLGYAQKRDYYEIRKRRRMYEGRIAYMKAFKAEKQWPDPNEIKRFKAHLRLINAPMKYTERVRDPSTLSRNYVPDHAK